MNTDASGFDLAVLCPLFSGVIAQDLADDAAFVFYDGTVVAPGTWTLPNPTTVQQAIDRLAVAVSGLLGGSIP